MSVARELSEFTFGEYAACYLADRVLRPNTVRGYESLLATRLLPHFAQTPLSEVTLTRINAWRASLDPQFEATNAAAYRLLFSILQAAVEEELTSTDQGNDVILITADPCRLPEQLRLSFILSAVPQSNRCLVPRSEFEWGGQMISVYKVKRPG